MTRTFGPCGEIVVQGGAGFVANETFTGNISSGSSGVLLNVPGQQGKSIKLTMLVAQAGTEAGITVTCGTRDVIDSLELEDSSAVATALDSAFVVGVNADGASNIPEILAEEGESLTITKDSGSTGTIITYAYQVSV